MTDNDPRALEAARRNAEAAGVADQLHFQEKSFERTSSKREHGCVITNPPYGERLADDAEVAAMHDARRLIRDADSIFADLVAEVAFAEFTADGYLRHASFLGLRGDKDAAEVRVEAPMEDPKESDSESGTEITLRGIRISSSVGVGRCVGSGRGAATATNYGRSPSSDHTFPIPCASDH